MNEWTKRLALLLVVLLALTAPFTSLAEGTADETVPEFADAATSEEEYDPVLITFNDTEIRQSTIVDYARRLYEAGYTETETDYDQAIDYILCEILTASAKIAELGLDQFTDDELAALTTAAEAELEQYYQKYIGYYAEDGATEADLAALRTEAIATHEEYGVTVEYLLSLQKDQTSFNRLLEYMAIETTEDDIAAVYADYVDFYKQYFENNIADYEQFINYGNVSYYVPAGYRAVIQILLTFDGADLTAYKDVANSADADEAAVAAARETLLDTRREAIDDIYARLAAGESFETLIAEYNADPGMSGETLKTGYQVHRLSANYDKAFLDAAFADNMLEPGDVSEPFIGIYGAYIVCYLADVPEGALEMSESVREEMRNIAYNTAVYDQLSAWSKEYTVVYDETAIAALKAGV